SAPEAPRCASAAATVQNVCRPGAVVREPAPRHRCPRHGSRGDRPPGPLPVSALQPLRRTLRATLRGSSSMRQLLLGHEHHTRTPFHLPVASFDTHWHFLGGTGKGKTTALHTLLHGLLLDPVAKPAIFLFDRLGNLSFELLLWLASPCCPAFVRQRFLYLQ